MLLPWTNIALLVNNKQSPLGIIYLKWQNSIRKPWPTNIVLPCRLHLQTQKPQHKKLPWIKKIAYPIGILFQGWSFKTSCCWAPKLLSSGRFTTLNMTNKPTWSVIYKNNRRVLQGEIKICSILNWFCECKKFGCTVLWKKTKTKQKQKNIKFWLKCSCEQSEITSVWRPI